MSNEAEDDRLSLPIEVLGLNLRVGHALKRANVITLSDINRLGYEGLAQIYTLGPKQIPYILNELNGFLIRTAKTSLSELKSEIEIPSLYEFSSPEKPNLVSELAPFVKSLTNQLGFHNDYEVIKRRYGLEGSKNYTLQEIGDYFGITRERVRQIEVRAQKNVCRVLTGRLQSPNWHISNNVIKEAEDLIFSLQNFNQVITENEALHFMRERYGNTINELNIGSIQFLMVIAGFEKLPRAASYGLSVSLAPAWILSKMVEKSLLLNVVIIIYRLLLKEIKPVSTFDVFVTVNGRLKRKVDPMYLNYALKICSDIQKTNSDNYEIRFHSLPSVADKAYRILHKANQTLTNREILRQINYLQVSSGEQDVHDRTLYGQLASDARFEPIGKSGEWSLAEWTHIAKETILQLMEDFFHIKQVPSSAKEVFDYVKQKRQNVKLNSVRTYLNDKPLFIKVAKGKYGLSAWGLKPLDSAHKINKRIDASQIDLVIKKIFAEKNTDKLPLWLIVEDTSKRTGINVLTVRKKISNLPFLDLEPHPIHPRRKYLRLLKEGNFRVVHLNNGEPKILLRDKIKKEIENFLTQQPENSASLSDIASHVMKKTGCIKPTFYHYLGEMENVVKFKNGSTSVCKLLLTTAPLSFSEINSVADNELKDNLKRAEINFTIEHIDSGLFQLGKIFENELKKYLNQAKIKGSFPVYANDLKRLTDMIDCIERNKIITEKHHLTLLREQRNERAHGNMPTLDERRKLMQHAPFLGDMYIKYIIFLNEMRQKLQ